MSLHKLKTLSLFSGIGLFDYGLEQTGFFETVAFCEINEICHEVLNKHWPDTPKYFDVRLLSGKDWKGYVDVIVGGYPCIGHSVAGKKEGLKNEDSRLWYEYLRIIRNIEPRYVIIENSHNIRSTGLAGVIQDISEAGYNCEWQIFSGYGVGSPHQRERIYIVAWRRDISYPDPFRCWPTYTKKEKSKSEWWAERWFERNPLYGQIGTIKSRTIRVNDGDTEGLHGIEERIRQLGNSLVIDIPKNIGFGIAYAEGMVL